MCKEDVISQGRKRSEQESASSVTLEKGRGKKGGLFFFIKVWQKRHLLLQGDVFVLLHGI